MLQFTVTEEMQKEIEMWDKCKHKYHGAIGGHLSYIFVPTSIVEILTVKCASCGDELIFYDEEVNKNE